MAEPASARGSAAARRLDAHAVGRHHGQRHRGRHAVDDLVRRFPRPGRGGSGSTSRQLLAADAAGARWHGRSVAGPDDPRSGKPPSGHQAALHQHRDRGGTAAFSARVLDPGGPEPSRDRHVVRSRRHRGWPSVSGDGVRGGRDAAGVCRRAALGAAPARGTGRQPGRSHRPCAPAADHPSRHQAVERAGHGRWAAEAAGLRRRQSARRSAGRRRRAHAARGPHGDAGVRRSRADRTPAAHHGRRRARARRRLLRTAVRHAAVRSASQASRAAGVHPGRAQAVGKPARHRRRRAPLRAANAARSVQAAARRPQHHPAARGRARAVGPIRRRAGAGRGSAALARSQADPRPAAFGPLSGAQVRAAASARRGAVRLRCGCAGGADADLAAQRQAVAAA